MSDEELVFNKLMRLPKQVDLINEETEVTSPIMLKPLPIGQYGLKMRRLFNLLNQMIAKQDTNIIYGDEVAFKLVDELITAMVKLTISDDVLAEEIAFTYHDQLFMHLVDINSPFNPQRAILKKVKELQEAKEKEKLNDRGGE